VLPGPEIDIKTEARVFAVFEEDVRRGFLIRHPLPGWPPERSISSPPYRTFRLA
jgi:hypothetical protein